MVIHFAGLTAAGDSMKDPLSCCDVNAGGTLALLHAMDRLAPRRPVGTPRNIIPPSPINASATPGC